MTTSHDEQPTRALSPREFAECIVDTVREPLVVLEADLRVRSANRSFYRSFRVLPEETDGRLIYELGNGQWNIPGLRTLLEEILPRDHSFRDFEVDHVFEGLGRRRMILNARKLWREGNNTEMILLAIEDVTDRWRAEVELRDSRERYRLIVESATGYSIFTTDLCGLLTTWNPGAEKIFGYVEGEMIGADIRIIYTPEDRESGQADLEMRTAEAEGRALDERWHVRKGGERFWADGLVMPLKDDVDRTRGFLKILRDMTGQRRLEESLRQRTTALEQADAHKNEFLAMLAHELRNPLAAISNAVAVSAHQDMTKDFDWSQGVISRQVGHLSRLIDDLLDISRITHNKIQLRKETIDARPVLRQAVDAVRPFAEVRNQNLALAFTSPDLWLHADPMRLEQIVVNLLTNAAKYTPSGGHIQLDAGVEGKEVVIVVRDDGIGIPPEMLARMFDLFAQEDRSLARSEGGLGIGLTLVRSLVELHGGTVTATSAGPGLGSEFVVRFPAVSGTSAARAPKQVSTKEPARRVRILVVDDSADTAIGMAKLLKRLGHDVGIAHDGRGALESASAQRPEVILLDIGLPGMDGYEVAAKLRLADYGREAILIAISGYGGDEFLERMKAAGFDHHLVKPVDFDALLTLLDRADAVA